VAFPQRLIDVKAIYLESAVRSYARGQHILAQHPAAELIEVDSHWNIPKLHGNEGSAEDWLRIKRDVLVLGVKKGLSTRPKPQRSLHCTVNIKRLRHGLRLLLCPASKRLCKSDLDFRQH
jgi:spore photoproduct lyase